jgi:hypothetical protein
MERLHSDDLLERAERAAYGVTVQERVSHIKIVERADRSQLRGDGQAKGRGDDLTQVSYAGRWRAKQEQIALLNI